MPSREKFDLDITLSRLPRPAQHQGPLQEQMIELRTLAVHFGLYDADSWLQRNFFEKRAS
jgi:hypothetical protein